MAILLNLVKKKSDEGLILTGAGRTRAVLVLTQEFRWVCACVMG